MGIFVSHPFSVATALFAISRVPEGPPVSWANQLAHSKIPPHSAVPRQPGRIRHKIPAVVLPFPHNFDQMRGPRNRYSRPNVVRVEVLVIDFTVRGADLGETVGRDGSSAARRELALKQHLDPKERLYLHFDAILSFRLLQSSCLQRLLIVH